MKARTYDVRISIAGRLIADIRRFPLLHGGVTLLLGESGIGKSLLAKSLFGILDSDMVSASIDGEAYELYHARPEIRTMRTEGFFVFQEPSTHLNPLMTIDEQIREGDLSRLPDPLRGISGLWDPHDQVALRDILPVRPTPYRPSGGEKQRVLAGMALAKLDLSANASGSALFVFDEPTGNLDRDARDRFLHALLERQRRNPQTILLVTHDYSMIGYFERQDRKMHETFAYIELVRTGKTHEVRPFSLSKYSSWIASLQPSPSAVVRSSPLLEVEGGISVFGKTLQFAQAGHPERQVTLKVHSGELVYLKAPSGIGKTTVAKIISGLLRADHYRVTVDGVRLGEVSPHSYWRKTLWGKKLTMVFQHADEALNPRSTVDATLKILKVPSLQTPVGRAEALRTLFAGNDLSSLLAARVSELSGGEKQRLNLVRAIALHTPVLILDEPLNALDFDSILRVLGTMEELRREGRGLLLVSHNEDIFDLLVPQSSTYTLTVARKGT